MKTSILILSLLFSFGAIANTKATKVYTRPTDIFSILSLLKYDSSTGKLAGGRVDVMTERALAGYRVSKIEISKDGNFCNVLVTYQNPIDHTTQQERSNVVIGDKSMLEMSCVDL